MVDKQVIDGERMFKCVWCKYDFKESDANFILSENPNECVCSGCMTEWANNLLWDFKRKEQECEKYKQTLTEIKEIAKEFCNTCQEFETEKKDRNCMYCNYDDILQKISECEV